MKSIKLLLLSGVLFVTLGTVSSWSQDHPTEDEIDALIKEMHECFIDLSLPKPHAKTYHLSSGKTVEVQSQNDYERSAFVSADKTLEDILLWKSSPYLWEQQHRKNGHAIMDRKELSDWELQNFNQIADSYFKGTSSTFHLAAHGLVDPENADSGHIRIGGQDLDVKETAELIKLSINESKDGFQHIINGEEQKFVIVLHSCHTAEGENSFAKQLSEELGDFLPDAYVIGAPDLVVCSMDFDKKEYKECVASEQEMRRAGTRGEIEYKQKWRVFKEGQDTGLGDIDYKTSVLNAQKAQ